MAENALLNLYEGPGALRDPRLRDVRDSTAWPALPPFSPRPSAELRRYSTPSDPTGPSEVSARELGDNLAQRNYGHALINTIEMILGGAPIPGARRGRSGGQRGSQGGAGEAPGAGAEAGRLPERGSLSGGDRGFPPSGGAQHPYVAIPGQPSTVKLPGVGEIEARPIPQIEAAAKAYAESRGRPYEVASEMPPIDIERSRRIAAAYEAMKHDPQNPDVKRAYDAMIEETLGQYKALKDQGFEFKFNKGGEDPYAKSPALGYLDMMRGRLSVFPTLEGFGSGVKLTKAEVANNPLLQDVGVKFGPDPATANDVFRAVHDAFGHHGPGNPFFRGPGEDRAFKHHQIIYDDAAWPAIASELRGQNSWLNYGPHAEHNKTASGADTIYADQKTGIMPPWTWLEGMAPRKPGGE